jgi:starch synthase (maltosyl-transferring)
MGMMIDLVISHCAIDSELTRQHPEWFVHEPNGRIAHPYCMENGNKVEWRDLAQFDHLHTSDPEGLYGFLAEVTEYLIGLGYTGFRCDAAYQIPRNLWQRLIRDVKKRHPDVVFTAETLGCTAEQTKATAKAGFDYVFNSSKWWDFHSPWLLEQYQLVREITPSISFPESHDTERLYHESQGNLAAMEQRYLFAALFSAGVMMPIGFEFGFRKRLHVVKTRPEDWEETDVDLQDFIREVNGTKRRYRVFQEECPTSILPYQNPHILLLWKACPKAQEEALIILNKDPWNHQHFHVDDLQAYVQAGTPLMDVSPKYPMEYIATQPFSYDLHPGQGLVLVTAKD